MNLRKTVIKSKENDYEKMSGAVESMRNVVRQFRLGNLPDEEFSLDDFRDYINHLIDIQNEDGTWTVASRPDQLAEDERVEFISFPTFLGVGALVMADEFLPGEEFPGLDEAREKGVSAIKLEGYGEDSLFQMIEMILILIEAGIPVWIGDKRSHEIYGRKVRELIFFRERLEARLDGGDTVLPFGGDYRAIFELVVSGLSVL